MRIFLFCEALIWLPYGLFLLFNPEYLIVATEDGLLVGNPTGLSELRAMYGGLQAAIGVFCLWAVAKPRVATACLLLLSFLATGLLLGRFLGVFLDGSLSTYTTGALVFEGVTAAVALFFLRRRGTSDVLGA